MQTLTIVTLEESKQVENRLRLAVNTQLPGGTEYICLFLSVARVSVGSHFNRRVISTELSGWDDWVEVHRWSYTDQGLCSVKNYKNIKNLKIYEMFPLISKIRQNLYLNIYESDQNQHLVCSVLLSSVTVSDQEKVTHLYLNILFM